MLGENDEADAVGSQWGGSCCRQEVKEGHSDVGLSRWGAQVRKDEQHKKQQETHSKERGEAFSCE